MGRDLFRVHRPLGGLKRTLTQTMDTYKNQQDSHGKTPDAPADVGPTARCVHGTSNEPLSPPNAGPLLRDKNFHRSARARPRMVGAILRQTMSASDLCSLTFTGKDLEEEDLCCNLPMVKPLALGEPAVQACEVLTYSLRYVAQRRKSVAQRRKSSAHQTFAHTVQPRTSKNQTLVTTCQVSS